MTSAALRIAIDDASIMDRRVARSASDTAARRNFGLDVVRSVAIAAVLVAHIGAVTALVFGASAPEFVGMMGHGVELFFVLSGFLIGSILLNIVEKTPTLRAWMVFLVRRWVRTLPLYVLATLILLVVLPPQGEPASYALRYLTFSQNLLWPMPQDNWFGVSWSLAVEEWFYLLFSSVLLMTTLAWPRKSVAVTCALFLVLPLLCRVVYASGVLDPDGGLRKIVAYRLDAITYGVAIAAWTSFRPRFVGRWSTVMLFGGGGLAAIGCWFLFRLPIPELRPFMLSLIPLWFSLCLPAALRIPPPPDWVRVAVTWLSTRSYGLYIVHLSILELAFRAIAQSSIPVPLGLFFFVFWPVLLAELSYRFLEMPLLRLRPA